MIENLSKDKCILLPKGYQPREDVCFCIELDCEKYHVAYNITLLNKRNYQTAVISLDDLSPERFLADSEYMNKDETIISRE